MPSLLHTPGRFIAVALALSGVAAHAPVAAPPAGEGAAASIESTRDTLDRWIEARRVISREERDWALAREILSERIDLMKRDIDSVRARIAEAEAGMTDAERKRAALVEEDARMKAASAEVAAIATGLEARVRALLARVPDPLRERVKPLSQRMPPNPAETTLSTSVRFQNVVGILNEINKFNRDIVMTSEVRRLPDGSSAEVTALYLGIAQGYYVGAKDSIAGIGSAGADGWQWTEANDAAPRIAAAIAILKNERLAEFVSLPVKLD